MLPLELHRGRKSAHGAAAPPFPAQQLFILGMNHLRYSYCFLPLHRRFQSSRSSRPY